MGEAIDTLATLYRFRLGIVLSRQLASSTPFINPGYLSNLMLLFKDIYESFKRNLFFGPGAYLAGTLEHALPLGAGGALPPGRRPRW